MSAVRASICCLYLASISLTQPTPWESVLSSTRVCQTGVLPRFAASSLLLNLPESDACCVWQPAAYQPLALDPSHCSSWDCALLMDASNRAMSAFRATSSLLASLCRRQSVRIVRGRGTRLCTDQKCMTLHSLQCTSIVFFSCSRWAVQDVEAVASGRPRCMRVLSTC